jgi:DtxR family manganese transport transcriptional regulator
VTSEGQSSREKGASKDKGSKKNATHRRRQAAGDAAAVARQARRYSKTRRDHSAEIAEDYVELIAQLIRQRGEARTVDIAERLGVSHVTATKTINRLQQQGLVRSEPYRSIFLTEEGQRLASRSEARHELVVTFLRKLGVNAGDAEVDAEGLEHHVGEATMAAIRRFVEEQG